MNSGRSQQWLSHPRAPQVIIAGFTILFLIIGFWSLGVGAFPSNGWKADGEVVLDFGSVQRVDYVLLAALNYGPINARVACGEPSSWSHEIPISASLRFKQWYPVDILCETRYLLLNFTNSRVTVAEVVPFQSQRVIPVASVMGPRGSEKLSDEESFVTESLSYRNSAYFDEPLFVGTAEQYEAGE